MAVLMDTDRVQMMATGFEAASTVLHTVASVLEAAMNLLKVTAFVGLVGGLALERYLAAIHPQIIDLAEYCTEIHDDLETAIQKFIAGDEEGASRFY